MAGQSEVHVQRIDGSSPRIRVSSDGGREPLFSPVADEIFYSRGSDVIAVTYRVAGSTIHFGEERVLFEVQDLIGHYDRGASWSISPDGQRFLMLQPGANTPSRPEFRVVYGW